MGKKKRNKWRTYELLVYKYFCNKLEGTWEVTYDIKIKGESESKRQIDILLSQKTTNKKIIIDCKNYNSKISIKDVESVIGMMGDLKAEKGIMVSLKGFQKGAKNRAKKFEGMKLILLSLRDLFPYRFYNDTDYVIPCPNCDGTKDIWTGKKTHSEIYINSSDVVYMNDTEEFIKVDVAFCNSCMHQIFICTECKTKIALAFDDLRKHSIKYCKCGVGYSFYLYKDEYDEEAITYSYYDKDKTPLLSENNLMSMESRW